METKYEAPSTERNSSLSYLHSRDYKGIVGKFHAHISVAVENPEKDLETLKDFCRRSVGSKLTVIDLSDFNGRSQKDSMITRYWMLPEEGAVDLIIDDLDSAVKEVVRLGYKVLRVKLEHESLPTVSKFDTKNYREIHIKLKVKKSGYQKTMDFLKENSKRFGYVPSRNPWSIQGEILSQFINLRYYDGDLELANSRVKELTDFLKTNCIDIEEVKMETAIFDTNLNLDSWWACPCTTSCKTLCGMESIVKNN